MVYDSLDIVAASQESEAIVITELHQSHTAELERQQLLAECHALVASIGHKRYAVRLLRAAKNRLLLYATIKNASSIGGGSVGERAIALDCGASRLD